MCCSMNSLGDEYGASNGQISLVGNCWDGAKISRDAKTFNDRCRQQQAKHLRPEASLKITDMSFLIVCNIFDLIVKGSAKAGGSEG
jgi:hypothetical protein